MKAMVMLPTYNEKVNIERMVGEILKHDGVSVVVVDDSSPDGTGEIADRLAAENKGRIHVIHRKERGRGTAGIAGLRYAREQDVDCVFEMDADFSHDPKDIPRFLDKIGDFDVVIGSRLVKGSNSIRNPVRRMIGNGANSTPASSWDGTSETGAAATSATGGRPSRVLISTGSVPRATQLGWRRCTS